MNNNIRAHEVRLIDQNGKQVGVVSTITAINMAKNAGLDLIEISPKEFPPICKILDYGKYVFDLNKKKKKQKAVHVKEIKMRFVTDTNDYLIKIRKIKELLESDNKVKITIRFKGREIAYQNLGIELLNRAIEDLKEFGAIEQSSKMEGRQLTAVLAPIKKK